MFNLKPAALGVAFVGTAATMTLTAASAQALTLSAGDILNFTGGAEVEAGLNPIALPSTINFLESFIEEDGTTGGFAATYVGPGFVNPDLLEVSVTDITLDTYLGGDLYSAEFTNPFITFRDGVTFTAVNPVTVERTTIGGTFGTIAFNADPFMGVFQNASGDVIGKGLFSANQIGGQDGSYSATIEVVPEPITMLGAGAAIAFGGAFKRKLGKKSGKGSTKA